MDVILKRRLIQVTLFCFAALCLIAGIARGDAEALWRKAIFICLECIGIA
jgi:hypothetical protein